MIVYFVDDSGRLTHTVELTDGDPIPQGAIETAPANSYQVYDAQAGQWVDDPGSRTVYLTDLDGAYVGDDLAPVDPLDGSRLLVPAGATVDPPPVAGAGFVPVLSGGSWSLVEDHRGTAYRKSDGSQVSITVPGPLPLDCVSDPPPHDYSVWDDAAGSWSVDVAALRRYVGTVAEQRKAKGVTWAGYQVQTDPTSRENLAGAAAAAARGSLPNGITWRMADNTDILLTSAQVQEIADLVLAYVSSVYAAAWQIKAEIDAGTITGPAAVDAWPWP